MRNKTNNLLFELSLSDCCEYIGACKSVRKWADDCISQGLEEALEENHQVDMAREYTEFVKQTANKYGIPVQVMCAFILGSEANSVEKVLSDSVTNLIGNNDN